jgi:hypothetical protein
MQRKSRTAKRSFLKVGKEKAPAGNQDWLETFASKIWVGV